MISLKGQWRQSAATFIVNLLSVHVGIIIGLMMASDKAIFNYILDLLPLINRSIEAEKVFNVEKIPQTNLIHHSIEQKSVITYGYEGKLENRHEEIEKYLGGKIADNFIHKIMFFSFGTAIPLATYIGNRFGNKNALAVSGILFATPSMLNHIMDIPREIKVIGDVIFYSIASTFQFFHVPYYVSAISSSSRRRLHYIIRMFFMAIGLYFTITNLHALEIFKLDEDIYDRCLSQILTSPIFNVTIPVFFLIGLLILPESPGWLEDKKDISAAKCARDWFQIDEKPISQQQSSKADRSTADDVKFIGYLNYTELWMAARITNILIHAKAMLVYAILVSEFNKGVGNQISGPISIAIITVIIYLHVEYRFKIEKSHVIRYEICEYIQIALGLCVIDGLDALFKQATIYSEIFSIYCNLTLMVTKVAFYITTIGGLPSAIAVRLSPPNVTNGSYALWMTGIWIISWISTDIWWPMKLTGQTNYWHFGYKSAYFVTLLCICWFILGSRRSVDINAAKKSSSVYRDAVTCNNCMKMLAATRGAVVVGSSCSN